MDPKNENGNQDSGADQIGQALANLLNKQGNDAMGVASTLLKENFNLREKNRGLRTEIDGWKTKVVLSDEEVKTWETYKTFGKPDDLKKSIEERDGLKAAAAILQRNERLREVAEVAGFNAKVFATLARDAEFDVTEIEHDGQKIRQVLINVKDGDKTIQKPLKEYAAAQWADFMPALAADNQDRKDDGGTRYLMQVPKGKPPQPDDPIETMLKAKDEARKANPNPLMRTVPVVPAQQNAASTNK